MNHVGIIGFGRFGKVLASILQKGFDILAYDPEPQNPHHGVKFTDLDKVLGAADLFIAVPIRQFENIIQEIGSNLQPQTTLIDVCSVKIHPEKIMKKYLPDHCGYIASHPMFGPDSFRNGNNLKMMMFPSMDRFNRYDFWQQFFSGQGIQVIRMEAKKHDQLAARSQGITHFLGRALKDFGIQRTTIDTQGFRDLLDLVQQTCNDSWELYEDLQSYNPRTKEMIEEINSAVEQNRKKLSGLDHA